ncbi:MAG: hypothetical protein IK133_03910 [Clostridia bacterium]|nr:hypothetical protein [Clostridia bacterium]MBR5382946.1 hypothetical protein [Clostridia bacterium]
MYHYSQQMRQNTGNLRARVRLLAVLLVLVIIVCIALGVMYGRAASFRTTTRTQLVSRIRSCCADTRSLAQKLSSSVQSNTASSLAGIRSGIYAMDQLNNVAVQLYGEEGRIVPEVALRGLYEDIDSYFSILQTNTVSVLEIRELLYTHLTALQGILEEVK